MIHPSRLARVASERKAVPVYAVADLSGSMGFEGERRRLDVLADFVESLAWSAWRTGDAFGFVGCDEVVRFDWLMPLMRAQGVGAELAHRLRRFEPTGRHAKGLQHAGTLLRRQRSLVFLLSDFHLPLPELEHLLAGLAHHETVPVVLWDRAEFAPPDASAGRLAVLADAESGRRRTLWLRAAVRDQWRKLFEQRHEELARLFQRRRLRPLYVLDGFDADAVSAHFQ